MSSNTDKSGEEDLKAYTDRIIGELEKDARKKEVIKRLCEQPKTSLWRSLVPQVVPQLFLLLIGFALTGLVANILAAKWQSREWDRQQSRLESTRNTETKYAIISDLTKAVAESEGAKTILVDELTSAFEYGQFNKDRDAAQAKRMANWAQAKQNWILTASSLEVRAKLYFTNPQIHSKLVELKEKKRTTDDHVLTLIPIYNLHQEKEWRDNKGRNFSQNLRDRLDESKTDVEKLLKELVDLMVAEAQKS